MIRYAVVGGLTTVVDFGVFLFMRDTLGIEKNISNAVGVAVSIVFAYVANKLFVFQSKTSSWRELLTEMLSFFAARGVSLIINAGGFWLLATAIGIHDIIAKALVGIVVITLNYFFSKLVIFRKKKSTGL